MSGLHKLQQQYKKTTTLGPHVLKCVANVSSIQKLFDFILTFTQFHDHSITNFADVFVDSFWQQQILFQMYTIVSKIEIKNKTLYSRLSGEITSRSLPPLWTESLLKSPSWLSRAEFPGPPISLEPKNPELPAWLGPSVSGEISNDAHTLFFVYEQIWAALHLHWWLKCGHPQFILSPCIPWNANIHGCGPHIDRIHSKTTLT